MAEDRNPPGTPPQGAVVHDIGAARSRSKKGRATPSSDPRGPVETSPEARAARVDELKQQIANGTYNPDPKEIAAKLLEHGF